MPSDHPLRGCRECPPPELAWSRAPFLFEGPARRAVHRLKFSGWRSVAVALGDAMVTVCGARPDVVTWVPLSRRRLAERGFDQARALAIVVGRRLDLPVVGLLSRTADTPPQARRSGPDRRAAMAGSFRAEGRSPPRVLLVDDVLTTGATASACARVLHRAGAREVDLVTAARAISASLPARYTQRGSRLGLWLPEGDPPGSRCQPQAKRPT